MLRSNISLVSKTGVFWDSTQWDAFPRPFLNSHTTAYANALAAWARGETVPQWAGDLIPEVKKPMKGSLKFLTKTSDSFFNLTGAEPSTLQRSQAAWWRLADSPLSSTCTIAVRHLDMDAGFSDQQESLLVKHLQCNNQAIVLNTIATVERMDPSREKIVRELRELVSDHNDEIRSKAVCALTRLGQLDDRTIESAVDMLDSSAKHNVFAGIFALGSQESIDQAFMPQLDRAFMRALKSCDYEFVGLFASAYNRWLPDAKSYVQEKIEEQNPELWEIARDALDGTPEQLVPLG